MKKSNEVLLETAKSAANKDKRISCNLEDGELESQIPIHIPFSWEESPLGPRQSRKGRHPGKRWTNRTTFVLGTPGKQKATGKQHTKMSGIK